MNIFLNIYYPYLLAVIFLLRQRKNVFYSYELKIKILQFGNEKLTQNVIPYGTITILNAKDKGISEMTHITADPTEIIKKILSVACILFCIIIFAYFLLAMWAGVNVTETKTVITQIYDGENDSNNVTSDIDAPVALPVTTLFGIFLFCASIASLNLVYRLKKNRFFLLLIHYAGALLSFFVFIIAMSGYFSEGEVSIAFIACLLFSVLYFITVGIVKLVRTLLKKLYESEKYKSYQKYIHLAFEGFTAIVFLISLFALISNLSVIVKVQEDKTFVSDRVLENVMITVVTPLAPTFQNYLRYLATAACLSASYAVLFTKIKPVFKIAANFLIIAAGYTFIWLVGFDYFRLISAHLIPAIIIFLAIYLITLITVLALRYRKIRKSEEFEEYENQFLLGKKKK